MRENDCADRSCCHRPLKSVAVAICAAVLLLGHQASAQQPPTTQAAPAPASTATQPRPRPQPARAPAKSETSPAWTELSPAQQQALAPLAATWSSLSEGHKRKWLALSQNYPRMSAQEQATLRGRMIEWAALTPQQRTQARLNFAETHKLPPTDKKAAWEAYQALSPEEKRRLAASASVNKPPPIAAAVRPVPPQRLASTPKAPRTDTHPPRIAVSQKQAASSAAPTPASASSAPMPRPAASL